LAEFLADSQWQDVPDEVRHEAKRTILNFVGAALAGCRDEAMELAVRALKPFFGQPQATVIGCSERPDVLSAAFLNAISANVLEFDDTHLPTVIHPAAPVAPALFAISERRPVSGRELLHGMESRAACSVPRPKKSEFVTDSLAAEPYSTTGPLQLPFLDED
jgi:2-methylcitrate dehydratase PrpD